jgi:signal peptidase I
MSQVPPPNPFSLPETRQEGGTGGLPSGPFGPIEQSPPSAPIASTAVQPAEPLSTTGVPHYLPPAAPPFAAPGAAADTARPRRPARAVFRPVGRAARELAETVILAILIFLLVRSVVQNFQVEGRSMEPTLQNSEYLLVNKALYWEINLETLAKFIPFIDTDGDPTRYLFRGPQRGDVIVFESPTQAPGEQERDFIKRIIGLPGETVEVRDCVVYINGDPLDEPYELEPPNDTYGPEVVPEDHYFVLGDNRNNSSDSRSWGMLEKSAIIGQAWLTYWPLDAFGLIDNTHAQPGATSGEPKPASCP